MPQELSQNGQVDAIKQFHDSIYQHEKPWAIRNQPTLQFLASHLVQTFPLESEYQNGNLTWLTYSCTSTTIRRTSTHDIFKTMCPSYPSLSYLTFIKQMHCIWENNRDQTTGWWFSKGKCPSKCTQKKLFVELAQITWWWFSKGIFPKPQNLPRSIFLFLSSETNLHIRRTHHGSWTNKALRPVGSKEARNRWLVAGFKRRVEPSVKVRYPQMPNYMHTYF